MISGKHPNRQAHNWLLYDISDRLLAERAPLLRGALYDLGAGDAPYRDFFLRHADSYIAVDWAGSLHSTRPDIVADLNEPLPIASGVADTVVALSVLEHLREPQLMLSEAFRILKDGGHLVLQVPWQWWIHEAPHDYYRYTPYGLQYLAGKAGFADIAIQPQGGFFTTMVLKSNYFSRRLVQGPGLLRAMARPLARLGWFIGQKLAPALDRLDSDWASETSGYYLTARKK